MINKIKKYDCKYRASASFAPGRGYQAMAATSLGQLLRRLESSHRCWCVVAAASAMSASPMILERSNTDRVLRRGGASSRNPLEGEFHDKDDPLPGELWTPIEPRCCCTIQRAIASPSPAP